MPFKLSEDSRNFFRFLTGGGGEDQLETLFDAYYLCLMAGISHPGLTLPRLGDDAGDEFIQQFPDRYFNERHQLIALMVASELSRQGVDVRGGVGSPEERVNIEREVLRLVDHEAATHLSSEGISLMNRYADGGSLLIREHFREEPRNLHSFLVEYYRWLNGERHRAE